MTDTGNLEATHKQQQNLFTHLGLAYLGPVDGNDLIQVEHVLAQARDTSGPVLVHVMPEKAPGMVLTDIEQHEHKVTSALPNNMWSQRQPAWPTQVFIPPLPCIPRF